MSVLQRFLGADTEARAVTFQDVFGAGLDLVGNRSAAGINVTEDRALTLTAVYGSVRILSEGVSKLIIEATRGLGSSATPVDLPEWVERPSVALPHLGMGEILDQVMMSLLLRGNAYILTPRDESGRIQELIVLDPSTLDPVVEGASRRLSFKLHSSGRRLSTDDVTMVVGLSRPGQIKGIAPLDFARETIGLGLAAQEYGATFFRDGAQTSGLIEVDGALSKEGAEALKRSWNSAHQGSGKANRVAVLTEGATFKPISVTPEQAQFLATRAFQVPDVARLYGVPPHLLQDASGSTSWGSGLAEQSTNYVVHSLRPWTSRIDAMLTRMARSELPPGTQRRRRLNLTLQIDHLTRGDFNSRINTYGAGLDRGVWNLDEVRAMEGLPELPEGAGKTHRVLSYTESSAENLKETPRRRADRDGGSDESEEDDDEAA